MCISLRTRVDGVVFTLKWSSFVRVHVSGKRQQRLCDGGAEVSELSARLLPAQCRPDV